MLRPVCLSTVVNITFYFLGLFFVAVLFRIFRHLTQDFEDYSRGYTVVILIIRSTFFLAFVCVFFVIQSKQSS